MTKKPKYAKLTSQPAILDWPEDSRIGDSYRVEIAMLSPRGTVQLVVTRRENGIAIVREEWIEL